MQDPNIFNEVIGRLRINESKITTLRERLLVTDSNMIEESKRLSEEIKNMNEEIRELKNVILSIRETVRDVIKSTDNFASMEDVKVLEKYINVWNPLNFITEKEVRQIVQEKKQNG